MTTAQELKDLGLALFHQDRLDEAVAKFEAAAQLFAAEGQNAEAAEMRNNIGVVRLAQKDWEAAWAAVVGTPEIFRQRGDRLREAQALSNLAAAADGAGRLDEAAGQYEQAIDLFSQIGDKENRAACWKALSALQIKQDKKLQALASMQAGLNLSSSLSPREKTLKGLLDRAMKMIGGR